MMTFIGSIFRSFFRDDCLNLAANISFCALLALIPIAMMMVSIAGYFLGGSQDALGRIVEVAVGILPMGRETFVANLESILDQRGSLGIVGIGFLVFIATILVASIERALDIVFKTTRRRHFLHSRLLGVALIFWVTLLFSLPSMAQILEGLFARFGFNFPLAAFMTAKVFFILVAFLAYIMTVVIVPNRRVHIRYALLGGLVFAVGLGLAKFLFRAYMLFALSRYNIIYGSLTAAVLLVVWIYYLALVLLIAAEFVAGLEERRPFHRKQDRDEITEHTDWDGIE
jgi:membrane protein